MKYGRYSIVKEYAHYVVKDEYGRIVCTADTLLEAMQEVDNEEAA